MSDIVPKTIEGQDLANQLGYLVAYRQLTDNEKTKIYLTAEILSTIVTLVDINGHLYKHLDKTGTTYDDVFKQYHRDIADAIHIFSMKTDDWKDSLISANTIFQALIRIMMKEGLGVSIYRHVHEVQADLRSRPDVDSYEGDA